MKKLSCFFMCMSFIAMHAAKAQYYYYNEHYYDSDVLFEVGVSPGIMNCLTDIGGKKGVGKKFLKDLNWAYTRPCTGIYTSIAYRSAFTIGLAATSGTIQAYDSILYTNPASADGRYKRNLSFRSPIIEARLFVEAYPLNLFSCRAAEYAPQLSPYLSAGIGFFGFNPRALYKGQWYNLHELHTEGQDFPGSRKKLYRLGQVNVPLGAGLRYEASALVNLYLELVYRILFTDYLDDVSGTYADPSLFPRYLPPELAAIAYNLADRRKELDPSRIPSAGGKRGNPENRDSFFSIQLKLSIVLGRARR